MRNPSKIITGVSKTKVTDDVDRSFGGVRMGWARGVGKPDQSGFKRGRGEESDKGHRQLFQESLLPKKWLLAGADWFLEGKIAACIHSDGKYPEKEEN